MEQQILDSDLITNINKPFDWREHDASRKKRFLNYLVDVVAFLLLSFAAGFLLAITGNADVATDTIYSRLISVAILCSYYFVFEASSGKTLGKVITKTRVVDEQGEKPTPTNILGRTLCRLIPFDALSFLGSGLGWHDSISKTYVVNDATMPF